MRRAAVVLVASVIIAAVAFYALLHQISGLWLDVALNPDAERVLARSMDDQKRLRQLDPANREAYRQRFEETQKLVHRMDVIRMSRAAMLRRFELALIVVFAVAASVAGAVAYGRYRRAHDRERRQYLERLTGWQQAARRHAHEIKGPLTALRLELERLVAARSDAQEVARIQESINEELTRLTAFTREFSSFGALGQPVLRSEALERIVEEFFATFSNAWPNLELRVPSSSSQTLVCADRDMLRQVLVNLCANSACATDGHGSVTFKIHRDGSRAVLDVRDTGRGIPEALSARVFDPYVTTRKIGEGMGLGLPISRKIMLDHGGDLTLLETSPSGTTFRLTFGDAACT